MVFSSHGELLSKAFADISVRNPENGWIEVDGEEVWRVALATIQESISKAGMYVDQLASVSIANERGAAMLWDKISRETLTPLIAPQCKRTHPITESWRNKKLDNLVLKRTGLPIRDSCVAGKLVWLLTHHPHLAKRAKKREVLFGGLDSWLLWNLTLGKSHATDYTNAAATMLFDLRSFGWDRRLLNKFRIPEQMLPAVLPSSGIFGKTEQQGILPEGLPIGAVAADQPAALYALTGLQRGLVKASYDCDCFVMMNIGERAKFSKAGLATSVACTAKRRSSYILEGVVPNGGWSVYWLKDSLGLIDSVKETSAIAESATQTGSRGIFFVPQHGTDTNSSIPGGMMGLRSDVTPAHLVRAALESVAFEMHNMMNIVSKDAKASIRRVFVDGPMSQNDFLLQFQADISNLEVGRTRLGETAGLGVSQMACLAVKQAKNLPLVQPVRSVDQQFRPHVSAKERKMLISGWQEAVEKVRRG